MIRHLQRLAMLLLTGLIVGCTSLPPPTSDSDAYSTPPVGLAPWTARGKIVITGGEIAERANFVWQRRSADHDTLQLSGPLGLGAIIIDRIGAGVYWRDGARLMPLSTLNLPPPSRDLLAALPYSELGDWLTAATAPDDNWIQQVTRWQTQTGWRVPASLRLSSRDMTIRMAVSEWQLP